MSPLGCAERSATNELYLIFERQAWALSFVTGHANALFRGIDAFFAGFRARRELVGQPVRVHRVALCLEDLRFHRRIVFDDSFGFFPRSGFENNQRHIVPVTAIHSAGQSGAAGLSCLDQYSE